VVGRSAGIVIHLDGHTVGVIREVVLGLAVHDSLSTLPLLSLKKSVICNLERNGASTLVSLALSIPELPHAFSTSISSSWSFGCLLKYPSSL
jgi:hypothetical protein